MWLWAESRKGDPIKIFFEPLKIISTAVSRKILLWRIHACLVSRSLFTGLKERREKTRSWRTKTFCYLKLLTQERASCRLAPPKAPRPSSKCFLIWPQVQYINNNNSSSSNSNSSKALSPPLPPPPPQPTPLPHLNKQTLLCLLKKKHR